MLVEQKDLLDFLGANSTRYDIPTYQRVYSWGERQCEELWLDILRAGRGNRKHFLGTVLYSLKQDASYAEGERVLEVIDGQQRLMTASLLLIALARHASSNSALSIDADALRNRYICIDDETEKRHYRMMPSRHDVEAYEAVCEGKAPNEENAVFRNVAFFEERLKDDDLDINELIEGLEGLQIIAVEVEDARRAQSIFEGINSKGMPLNIADMIRNYLLLAESHDEQTRLYETYWKPSQDMFSPDPGSLRMNAGIKSWISIRLKKAKILSPAQVYSSFKKYVEDVYRGDKEPILRELRGFCLMWAENYRYHGTKKFKSGSDWAEIGRPTITADYKLKKAVNEEYAERVRKELREIDSHL